MVNVYIRRKKRFFLFYTRRRRGFETREPSPLSSCKDIPVLKEDVRSNALISNVDDFVGTGSIEGVPEPCIKETSQENAVQFESNAVDITIKQENGNVLNTVERLPDDVPNKGNKPFVNNDPLWTVLQQLNSALSLPRKHRSARKPTSAAPRKWSSFEYSASDNSKQKLSHSGDSASACYEVIPNTPNKMNEILKSTSRKLRSSDYNASDTSKQKVSEFGASTSVCCEVILNTPNKNDEIFMFTSRNLRSFDSSASGNSKQKVPIFGASTSVCCDYIPKTPNEDTVSKFTSRNFRSFEYRASDNSEQKFPHYGASTSACCEVISKTPNKKDKISKFASRNFLFDVLSVLSTGVLEGALVKYKNGNVELKGILTTSGICCGCSLCNFEQVVSSLKFEKHAGSRSNNQNDHIFLENGISLFALFKELKNIPMGSLGKVINEKFGHATNMDVSSRALKGNTTLHHCKGESTNQTHFPYLLDDLHASLNFPKGPRLARADKSLPSITYKGNHKVSRQLIFCDADHQHPPTHKKRGLESSDVASSDPSQSNIEEAISKNVNVLNIENFQVNMPTKYTLDSPLSTVSCLLATGLLEGLVVKYKKDKIDLCGFIKDLGICCGCSSCCFSKVLSSLDFGKHGGDASTDPNDYIFVNDKISLCSLVSELGKVSLGLLSGPMIQKMIGCQPNIACFLAWKELFHDKKSNQRSSCEDGKNQLADSYLYCNSSPAERLMFSASVDNLRSASGDNLKIKSPGQAQKATKQKEHDFHQLIFDLLNDGSKLSYRSHGKEVLIGYKFGKNILCSCCNLMISASKFEAHAGHPKRRKPYHSIYTSYNKSLNQIALFLLLDKSLPDAKDLKAGALTGENRPCGSSPFKFHSGRMMVPCIFCSCMLCRDGAATLNFRNICDSTMLFCGQCCGAFHVGCLRNHGICDIVARPCPPDSWLCGNVCGKVRAVLLDFIQGGSRKIPNFFLNVLRCTSAGGSSCEESKFDVHWQLLSGRFKGDKSISLLQQATTIFQEEFGAVYKGHRDVLSTMVNGEKGVAEFFGGIFCAVITVKSVIVSAALLRVFGNHIAELPLAVTPKKRQGEGYFKILLLKIEEMLGLLKVENLVLAADDRSLPMWVEKFGFTKLSTNKILEYQMNHRILMFENTTMLQKAVPSDAF